jgi:hypothetical protein
MTRLFLAALETRNFSFGGVGETMRDAQAALERAIRAHCQHYPDADLDYLLRCAEEAEMRLLEAGKGYRDGEEVAA